MRAAQISTFVVASSSQANSLDSLDHLALPSRHYLSRGHGESKGRRGITELQHHGGPDLRTEEELH